MCANELTDPIREANAMLGLVRRQPPQDQVIDAVCEQSTSPHRLPVTLVQSYFPPFQSLAPHVLRTGDSCKRPVVCRSWFGQQILPLLHNAKEKKKCTCLTVTSVQGSGRQLTPVVCEGWAWEKLKTKDELTYQEHYLCRRACPGPPESSTERAPGALPAMAFSLGHPTVVRAFRTICSRGQGACP